MKGKGNMTNGLNWGFGPTKGSDCANGDCGCGAKKNINVHLVLDRSGSMGVVREEVIRGLNKYLNGLRTDQNNIFVSLTQFDDQIEAVYERVPIAHVKEFNQASFEPRGMTALRDAVSTTIKAAQNNYQDSHLVVTITDGADNVSRLSQAELAQLIKSKELLGNWTFVYLGANQDSWANSSVLGYNARNTSNVDLTNFNKDVDRLTQSTQAYSCNVSRGVTASADFFGDQTRL